MKEIQIKNYVKYLFVISFIIFIFNKVFLRSWVLDNQFSEIFQIMVLSIPNLLEAIMGTLILTAILIQLQLVFNKKPSAIKDRQTSVLAVVLGAVYVISQELNFHSLGGNNVYDPYDLVASVIGLMGIFIVIQHHGFTYGEDN